MTVVFFIFLYLLKINIMCETYICEKSITLNPCSEGFYLFLDEADGLYRVTIYISNYGSVIKYSQLENKLLYVHFKALEYTSSTVYDSYVEIEVEKLSHDGIAIPVGIGCVEQCGFRINLGFSNNRVLLNKECTTPHTYTFQIPINNEIYQIPINNYTWQI